MNDWQGLEPSPANMRIRVSPIYYNLGSTQRPISRLVEFVFSYLPTADC